MEAVSTPAVPQAATSDERAVTGRVTLLSAAEAPVLELCPAGKRFPFRKLGPGRSGGESRWLAEPELSAEGSWEFRVDLGSGVFDTPLQESGYTTDLREFWLQDKQLYGYQPAPHVSPARVEKLEPFKGRLSARALYVYLPRGYDEHRQRCYPVIYLHDGQNAFETFVEDSFAGSWRADETASDLIAAGRMREAILVGVSNGGEARMAEYLPPYATYRLLRERRPRRKRPSVQGRADETAAYYQQDVAPFIAQRYRVLGGRDHTATLGSSMGGLFSTYLAFEQPEFARHHAAMSSTFWITADGEGAYEVLERLKTLPRRDIRLWLDSGEGKDQPGGNDDNKYATLEARAALLAAGYVEGEDFVYYLAKGARHQESDWAARLGRVLSFLMPAQPG